MAAILLKKNFTTTFRNAIYACRYMQTSKQAIIPEKLAYGDMMMWNPLNLKRLPIPELRHTLDRYLLTVKHHTNEENFQEHSKIVEDFFRTSGPKLQQLLYEKEAQSIKDGGMPHSYIEDLWWAMYLEGRWEVPVNSNPFFALHPFHDVMLSRAKKCARLAGGLLRWQHKVRTNQLEPDPSPVCVAQYPLQVGTARIARQDRDSLSTTPSSRHVVVLSNNKFFTLRVFDDEGRVIDETTLAERLEQIEQEATKQAPEPFVGFLSAGERNTWAAARGHLSKSQTNVQALKDIDSALFLISLDTEVPSSLSREGTLFLYGDAGNNRYFDKHSIVCLGNGALAMNFEHSWSDGVTWNRKLYEAYCWGNGTNPGEGIAPLQAETTSNLPPAVQLRWELDDSDKAHIRKAERDAAALTSNCKLTALDFQEFGKKAFKGWKVSPDAAMQLAFQLSYASIHHELPPVYEACSTSQFYRGRTETIRSSSIEAARFIQAMQNPQLSKAEKVEAFRAAGQKHVELAKLAKNGLGVDRHFKALRSLADQYPELELNHPLFEEELFSRSATWILSTSNVSSPQNKHFGFGPVTGQGYGLGYIISDNWVSVDATNFVSSGKTDSEKMVDTIGETLLELNSLCK